MMEKEVSEGGGINARVPGYHMGGENRNRAENRSRQRWDIWKMNILRLSAGSVRRKIRELYALSF